MGFENQSTWVLTNHFFSTLEMVLKTFYLTRLKENGFLQKLFFSPLSKYWFEKPVCNKHCFFVPKTGFYKTMFSINIVPNCFFNFQTVSFKTQSEHPVTKTCVTKHRFFKCLQNLDLLKNGSQCSFFFNVPKHGFLWITKKNLKTGFCP